MSEHKARMEMKTHTAAVMVSAGWPMLAGLFMVTVVLLVLFPARLAWPVVGLMGVLVALTFLYCVRMYMGTYLFLPATEFKGARIIAKLGKSNETELTGLLAGEIIIKQGPLEKLFGVCHIRQKGTPVYLRGVREPEKVQAWVNANFPKARPEKMGGKGKNKKGARA